MTRSETIHAIRRMCWLVGFVLATGCAHSRTELQDAASRDIMTVDSGKTGAAGVHGTNPSANPTTDKMVLPATVAQPRQDAAAPAASDRTHPLPSPLDERSSRVPVGSSVALETSSLPPDSDGATLDAIVASGKPMTLPEAIDLAYRHQPRLRAQLETIAQARGQQQIAFSTFLPVIAGNYDVGTFSLGVGGQPIRLGKDLPGFNFLPGLGALPIGLNLGTSFELAELKVQWLLLDFGRRLGRFEQARLAGDMPLFRPIEPSRRWRTRLPLRSTAS